LVIHLSLMESRIQAMRFTIVVVAAIFILTFLRSYLRNLIVGVWDARFNIGYFKRPVIRAIHNRRFALFTGDTMPRSDNEKSSVADRFFRQAHLSSKTPKMYNITQGPIQKSVHL